LKMNQQKFYAAGGVFVGLSLGIVGANLLRHARQKASKSSSSSSSNNTSGGDERKPAPDDSGPSFFPQDYRVPEVWQPEDHSANPFANINSPTAGARSHGDLPVGTHPLQLYSLGTPNGQKVTLLLEELGVEYDAWKINISQQEQFTSGFVAINPNSKIPALVDNSGQSPLRVFESGAILLYLADKYHRFIPADSAGRQECLNWLFWQVGSAPFIGGGFGHFFHYCKDKYKYAIDRFAMETKRLLSVMDIRLGESKFLAGPAYSIADMAVYPWVATGLTHYKATSFLQLDSYTNITRWMKVIQARPATQRGLRVNGWTADAVVERHSRLDFLSVQDKGKILSGFSYQTHINFFLAHLKMVPIHYKSLDTNRLTMLYFCLSALDVLGVLDSTLDKTRGLRQHIVDFVYAMQVHPHPGRADHDRFAACGFRGSSYLGEPFCCGHGGQAEQAAKAGRVNSYDEGHIAATYCALCVLLMCGDDLQRVNKKAVIEGLKSLQQSNGSFCPTSSGGESDTRFVYCACAISTILEDWSGVSKDAAAKYIADSQAYDGGIGMGPGSEGHGGTTYCGMAALLLMDRLSCLPNFDALLKWCLRNQGEGYRGRPEKPQDTCYSFWLGGVLHMLGADSLTNPPLNCAFNLQCQSKVGGFGKLVGAPPDIMHSYMGLCGLSLMKQDCRLQELCPILGITRRAASMVTFPEPVLLPT